MCFSVTLLHAVVLFWLSFFFFKQKTAYEMRISDWSSDVCSSDLLVGLAVAIGLIVAYDAAAIGQALLDAGWGILLVVALHLPEILFSGLGWRTLVKIGRASCRERVCQYV